MKIFVIVDDCALELLGYVVFNVSITEYRVALIKSAFRVLLIALSILYASSPMSFSIFE